MLKDYKPLGFFGIIALLLAVIALAFFVPIMVKFVRTGLVPNFPTLIVCGFTMLAAIQSFFTGMTLQTILHKNRQDFEKNPLDASEKKRSGM